MLRDASEPAVQSCPYMGLAAYTEDDADFFFGRDRERDLVIARLRASRLTLVYGQSGVGKSSLLSAGVVHRLKRLARYNLTEYGAPQFAVVSFASWQGDPLAGLKRAVKEAVEGALGDGSGTPVQDTGSLEDVLQICSERIGGSLYVILDQFEEYFRYSTHREARAQFAEEFARAVNMPGLRVNFLLSIREDMLARLDCFKGRIPSLFNSVLRIEHLDREGARVAIVSPLKRCEELGEETYEIDNELIDAVLSVIGLDEPSSEAVNGLGLLEASDEPRAVAPLLQLVMERLWHEERQTGSRTLRLATLEHRLGGARRIAETHIEERMSALSREDQGIAADILDRLVTPSGRKIAHTLRDLAERLDRSEAKLEPVLHTLCAQESRILRRTPEGHYEVYHDVWGRPIQTWLAEYRAIQKAAEMRSRRLRRWRLAAVGGALLVGMVTVASLLVRDWRDAAREARDTEAAELAVQSLNESDAASEGMIRAGLLAVESLRIVWTDGGERAGQRILSLLPPSAIVGELDTGVRAIRFSPDGEKLAIAATDDTIRIWTVDGGDELLRIGQDDVVHALSFSPDGEKLAVACGDGLARVWDLGTGAESIRVAHDGVIRALSFSPDGKRLATGSDDGTTRIWNAKDGHNLVIMSAALPAKRDALSSLSRKVTLVQFSPDGSRLATASIDNIIRIWDTGTGDETIKLKHDRSVLAVSFDLDGRRLTAVGEDSSVRVWNAATGAGREMPSCGGSVVSVSLSQDAKRVAIGSHDGTVSVWYTLTGGVLARMPHTAAVRAVSFSPDGTRLATCSDDGIVRIWATNAGGAILETPLAVDSRKVILSPHGRWLATIDAVGAMWMRSVETGDPGTEVSNGAVLAVGSSVFDPEGEHVVTLGGDGLARTWDSDSGETRTLPPLPPGSVLLAVGPGGRSLAMQSPSRTIVLWDVAGGNQVQALDYDSLAQAAVFSIDGTKVAVAGSDHTVGVWDPRTGERVAQLDHTGCPLALAFSSDGKHLATTDYSDVVRVWDIESGRVRAQMVHDDWVHAVSFSPNGRYLVTGSHDRTARLWGVASGRELERILHVDEVTGVAFNPTGTELITVSGNSVYEWQVRLLDMADELCARLPRNFTPAKWKQFFPDDPYRCTCENLPPCE